MSKSKDGSESKGGVVDLRKFFAEKRSADQRAEEMAEPIRKKYQEIERDPLQIARQAAMEEQVKRAEFLRAQVGEARQRAKQREVTIREERERAELDKRLKLLQAEIKSRKEVLKKINTMRSNALGALREKQESLFSFLHQRDIVQIKERIAALKDDAVQEGKKIEELEEKISKIIRLVIK